MSVSKPLVVAATLFMALAAQAAEPVSVKVEPRLAQASAAPGDSIEVIFHVEVQKGWHLYPPGATEGIPVSVKLAEVPGVTPGALEARSGKRDMTIEGVGKVTVLEGAFDLAWKLQVGKDAALGARKLAGKLTFQACNEETCEMERSTPFELALDVAPPSVDVGPKVELPDSGPVIANFSAAPSVRPGGEARVSVELFVRKGYHIYAPGTEGDSRVTQLELDLPAGFTAGALASPPPSKTETDEIGKALLWEGKVLLARTFKAPPDAKGTITIKARAHWLVCDEKGCRPGDDEKELTVAVDAAAPVGVPPITGPPTTDRATGPVTGPATGPAPTPAAAAGAGIGALILTAISLGFLNVLMPCTLPMIPITISIFSKGKKLTRGQSVFRASTYALGIIVSFALVGGVIQAIFGNSGQGIVRTIASNGPLNLGIGALFVYFALSFFGYYEIQLPEFLRNFVEKSVDKAKETGAPGESGVPLPALFLMGFFFVLTSYTCGAPLILGVLTAGLATPAKGSVVLATGVFGATTALPFFVLALVPGFLKSLPRSGGWFKTFKVVLGTIELAAALKFFSNADLYWRAGILTRNVFLSLWVVAGVLMTLYVAHVLKLAHDEEATEPAPKFDPKAWLRSVPLLLATIYVGQALNGTRIPPDGPGFAHLRSETAANFEAFLPPDPYPGTEPPPGATVGAAKKSPITEYASYDQALAAAKKAGKPLFLEFTGHT